ncbi:MAG: hypothetical protein RLZZ488_1856 [Pseudomonadota bacterium]|jgi:signal transduction histidine kinase
MFNLRDSLSLLFFNKKNRSSNDSKPAGGVREGGYLLILFSILSFALISFYLLGQKTVQPEPLSFSYFVEPIGREMSVGEAAEKLRAGEFKPYDKSKETLELGYMREGVWVLMRFSNPPESTVDRFVLQLRHTYINGSFTPLAVTTGNGGFALGETIPFNDKLLPSTQGFYDIRHVSFPLSVQPAGEFRALVRLRAHVMSVPFLVLSEREFLSSIIREMVVMASFFGGLMLLAVYNLMVGAARREVEFIFYGFYVSFISLMIAAINGSGHMFIWPDLLWLHYNSANILTNLCCISYLAFTLALFRGAPMQAWERGVWRGLLGVCFAGLLLQVFEGGFFASIQANLAVLATLCLSLVRAWRVRPVFGRLANLFLISEGMLFIGAGVYCIKMFGWLPSTPFTINIVTLAATLEGILLSFVLSEKMRRTMSEKEHALGQLAEAQKHLEASVRDRTLALAARYTSHEVLNPVFALRLKAERIRDEILLGASEDEVRNFPPASSILKKVGEMFRLIDSIIHTIRAIKTLSGDGLREEVQAVSIEAALDDALRMLEAKTLSVRPEITADFQNDARVFARRSDVVQILMNLISNSLDALVESERPWIKVNARLAVNQKSGESSVLEISVLDSGQGPRKDIRDQLFNEGVSTKDASHGMGLGLAFCQKLAQRNGGFVGYDASHPQTRFFFVLPVLLADRDDLSRRAA